MQDRYTIVIEDGTLKGASVHTDNGKATLADLAVHAPAINAAALARVAELESDAASRTQFMADLKAAIPTAKPGDLAAIIAEAEKPARDKELAKLEADRAALDARIDALKNPKPGKP